MTFRGVFHAHTTHSYDGQIPLAELCRLLKDRGYHFLLLTEHDDTLDAASYEQVRQECRRLGSSDFLVIPGLEIRCWRTAQEQWHIAALGVETWIPRGPIPEVLERIHRAHGLAILLHPYQYARQIPLEDLADFDGIEFWNGKYDGAYGPRWKSVRLVQRLRSRPGHPLFYCGHDLHQRTELAAFELQVIEGSLDEREILDRLRRGRFRVGARGARFDATLGPSVGQMIPFVLLHVLQVWYGRMRHLPVLGPALARLVSAGRRDAQDKSEAPTSDRG